MSSFMLSLCFIGNTPHPLHYCLPVSVSISSSSSTTLLLLLVCVCVVSGNTPDCNEALSLATSSIEPALAIAFYKQAWSEVSRFNTYREEGAYPDHVDLFRSVRRCLPESRQCQMLFCCWDNVFTRREHLWLFCFGCTSFDWLLGFTKRPYAFYPFLHSDVGLMYTKEGGTIILA